MGVLSRPYATKSFSDLDEAKAWADDKLTNAYMAGYSVIEGPDGFVTTSSCDGGSWE